MIINKTVIQCLYHEMIIQFVRNRQIKQSLYRNFNGTVNYTKKKKRRTTKSLQRSPIFPFLLILLLIWMEIMGIFTNVSAKRKHVFVCETSTVNFADWREFTMIQVDVLKPTESLVLIQYVYIFVFYVANSSPINTYFPFSLSLRC